MAETFSTFVGSIPLHYDTGLGPNIFVDYAGDMAARAAALAPTDVLEMAAGTGIVSRRLRDALPGARLVVTDLNPPMLEVAKTKFAPGEVEVMTANAMALPFDDGAFDMIVCQFGVMFFPDKTASFREAARVLRPAGHYLFSTWGTREQNLYGQVASEVVRRHFGGEAPVFMGVPFSYADVAKVRADLAAAGWEDVTHTALPRMKHIANPAGFARGLIMGNPMIDEIRSRGIDPEVVIADLAADLKARFAPGMEMALLTQMFECRKTGA